MGDFFAWAFHFDRPFWVTISVIVFLVMCAFLFLVISVESGAWYLPFIVVSFLFGRVIALYRREKRK